MLCSIQLLVKPLNMSGLFNRLFFNRFHKTQDVQRLSQTAEQSPCLLKSSPEKLVIFSNMQLDWNLEHKVRRDSLWSLIIPCCTESWEITHWLLLAMAALAIETAVTVLKLFCRQSLSSRCSSFQDSTPCWACKSEPVQLEVINKRGAAHLCTAANSHYSFVAILP